MHESGHLFVNLLPPPGGLQRLRRHLDNHSRLRPQQQPALRIAASALALSVIAVALLLPGIVVQHRRSAEMASALRAAVAAPPGGIRITDGAAIELPSGQANVRLYLVQSTTSTGQAIEMSQSRYLRRHRRQREGKADKNRTSN